MKLYEATIIESPYMGNSTYESIRNRVYLELCIEDSINRGEAPFASHYIYTDFLNDNESRERTQGICMGYSWLKLARKVAFYQDFEMSPGMTACLKICKDLKIDVEMRNLPSNLMDEIENRKGSKFFKTEKKQRELEANDGKP